MRWLVIAGLVGLLWAPAALAHDDHGGAVTYIVTAHDAETPNGTVAWFNVDNRTQANPDVAVTPGQRLFIHLVNAGSVNHTLSLGEPVDRSIGPVSPGNETSSSFQIPEGASGSIVYEDPNWSDRGMIGRLTVHDAAQPRDSPGPAGTAGLALLAAGLVARRLRER